MPHPVDLHVGSRVRLARNCCGLSQTQLGKALGLTFQQIQKYERGHNRIGAGRLYDIAKRLDVPITYFYDGLDGSAMIGEKEQPSNRLLQSLCKSFLKLKFPNSRRAVVNLVTTLAKEGV